MYVCVIVYIRKKRRLVFPKFHLLTSEAEKETEKERKRSSLYWLTHKCPWKLKTQLQEPSKLFLRNSRRDRAPVRFHGLATASFTFTQLRFSTDYIKPTYAVRPVCAATKLLLQIIQQYSHRNTKVMFDHASMLSMYKLTRKTDSTMWTCILTYVCNIFYNNLTDRY